METITYSVGRKKIGNTYIDMKKYIHVHPNEGNTLAKANSLFTKEQKKEAKLSYKANR